MSKGQGCGHFQANAILKILKTNEGPNFLVFTHFHKESDRCEPHYFKCLTS